MASVGHGCYVELCDKKYEGTKEKRYIFKLPSGAGATLINKWKSSIPKGTKQFDHHKDGICSKHFEDRYIRKEDVVNVCGMREVFAMDPWEITPDAVPTVFDKEELPPPSANRVEEAIEVKEEIKDVVEDTPVVIKKEEDTSKFNGFSSKRSAGSLSPDKESEPRQKKIKQVSRKSTGGLSCKGLANQVSEEFTDSENTFKNTHSGRPAHLKREIVPPSRIRDSVTEDDGDIELNDDYGLDSSSAIPSGSPLTTAKSKPGPQVVAASPLVSNTPAKIGKCFITTCDRNPYATLFKIPQMTKNKLKDWVRYIPSNAMPVGVSFDPRIHVLCEEHFDKKFIMNTPSGKILTGDAVPSVFAKFVNVRNTPSKANTGLGKSYFRDKSQIKVVDGYEIEYDDNEDDPDFNPKRGNSSRSHKRKGPPKSREPITVTIDDEDEDFKKMTAGTKKMTPVTSKSKGRILEIKDPGYNLQYIYDMRERIQLPQADVWILQMITDKETRTKAIYIAEIVARNERLIFRRSIKIRQDLTFKVEANGADFTQMFNEAGDKVDSLYKLQEMILDLSAFKVCEGWASFDSIEACSIGRKIEGIWFARGCEGLNLNNTRCRPCLTLKQSLLARKNGLALIADPNVVQQIRKLPKDDPLHLQLQVQDLVKERTKLRYDLSTAEKRESRLQERINMLETGMKAKGKTVFVSTNHSSGSITRPISSTRPTTPAISNGPRLGATARPGVLRPTRTPIPTSSIRSPVPSNIPLTRPPASSSFNHVPAGTIIKTTATPMPANISTIPQEFQEFLTPGPTFVLAQGSGIIGHQTVEAEQQLKLMNNSSSINEIVQKSQSNYDGQPDEITLLTL